MAVAGNGLENGPEAREFSWGIWLTMAVAVAICIATVIALARYNEQKVRRELNRRYVGTVFVEPGLVIPRLA